MPPSAGDGYFYPGTTVLKNKLDIRNADALRQYEYEKTTLRTREVRALPLPDRFDLAHLQKIHTILFRDVYAWAGELRHVDMIKGGTMFALTAYIESEGRQASARLAAENNLRGLTKAQFTPRLAEHYADWNALHPFREGNGRSTREFLGHLARGAGYELTQERIDNRQGQFNDAARLSMSGDLSGVIRIFNLAVRPARAVAFETLPAAEAAAQFPELAPAIASYKAIQTTLEQRFPNRIDTQQKYLSEVRLQLIKKLDGGEIPHLSPSKKMEPTPPSRGR